MEVKELPNTRQRLGVRALLRRSGIVASAYLPNSTQHSPISNFKFVISNSLILFLLLISTRAQDFHESLAQTPFSKTQFQAHQTEPVQFILNAFRPTPEMRAVVLMPAASDQLYFFNWGRIELPPNPTLLDALNALTNKAQLTYTFVAPFLLIHLQRDTTTDPLTLTADVPQKFHQRKKYGRVFYLDRPYDRILPDLKKITGLKSFPDQRSPASWHYYRLSFVAYNPTAAELLRAIAYGTKTSVHVEKRRVLFTERTFQR
jgi:hypothetical protein